MSGSMPDMPHCIGFLSDERSRQIVPIAAASRGLVGAEMRAGGIDAAHEHVAAHGAPAILVTDLSGCSAPLAAMDGLADICAAGTRVIAIGERNDVHLYRALRSLGVTDYVPKPLAENAVAEAFALALAEGEDAVGRQTRAKRAEVIACMGSRGGAGTTSVTLSLAHLLARRGLRVVLLDLDPQAGTAGFDIDSEPSPGFADLMLSPDRVDEVLLEAALKPHPLGFQLLSAEVPMDRHLPVKTEAIQALCTALGGRADRVLIDMPRRLDRAGRAVMRTADRMLIVSPPSLCGLRDVQRLSTLATGLRAGQKPLVALNRIGETEAEVSLADFSRALGGEPAARLSYRPRLAAAAALRSTVFTDAPGGHAWEKALGGVVDILAGNHPAAAKRGVARLMARFR